MNANQQEEQSDTDSVIEPSSSSDTFCELGGGFNDVQRKAFKKAKWAWSRGPKALLNRLNEKETATPEQVEELQQIFNANDSHLSDVLIDATLLLPEEVAKEIQYAWERTMKAAKQKLNTLNGIAKFRGKMSFLSEG